MYRTTLQLGVALFVSAMLVATTTTAGAQTDSFNEKFEFHGEVLGEPPVTENGTIYAGSKQSGPVHNLKQYTNCSYFDENDNFLGYYAEHGVASTDPDDVLNFCLDNFEWRSSQP